MSWKSYRASGGSSGFKASGSFKNAKVKSEGYTTGSYSERKEQVGASELRGTPGTTATSVSSNPPGMENKTPEQFVKEQKMKQEFANLSKQDSSMRTDTPEWKAYAQTQNSYFVPAKKNVEVVPTENKKVVYGSAQPKYYPTPSERLNKRLDIASQKANEYTLQNNPKAFLYGGETIALGVERGFFSAPVMVYQTLRNPVEVAKNIYKATPETGSKLMTNPGGEIGQIIGSAPVFKGVEQVQPFRVESFKVPTSRIEEFGTSTIESGPPSTIYTFGVKNTLKPESGFPLVTKSPEGIQFGNPDIRGQLMSIPPGKIVQGFGPITTKIISKNAPNIALRGSGAIEDVRLQNAVPAGRQVLGNIKYTKSKFIDTLPKSTEYLTPESTKNVYGVAREEKAAIFGGTSRRGQVPVTISDFKPADIDIRLNDASPVFVENAKTKTILAITKGGQSARPSPTIKEAVEVYSPKEGWVKAVEFKGKNLESSTPPAGEYSLGFKKESPLIKIEQNKVTTLREETRNLFDNIVSFQSTKKGFDFYPAENRIKDISSARYSVETLKQSKLRPQNLEGAQKRFFDLYPTQEGSFQIADFGEKTKLQNPNLIGYTPAIVSPNKRITPSSGLVRITGSYPTFKTSGETKTLSYATSVRSSQAASFSPTGIKYSNATLSPSMSPNYPSVSKVSGPGSSRPTSKSSSPISSPSSSPISSPSPSTTYSIPKSTYSKPYSSRYSPKTGSTNREEYSYDSNYPEDKKYGKGFNVFVRRRKKFLRVNPFSLTKEAALSYGAEKVRTTAAATFKIVPSTESAKQKYVGPVFRGESFIQKNGLFIQPSKKTPYFRGGRISSGGEKREITFKGIVSSKLKKFKGWSI